MATFKPESSDTRTSLLRATDRLMARFGFGRMTVEDVARETGIGKGSVYLLFESKEALALGVVDLHIAAAFARLREIAGRPDPVFVRLEKMLVARVTVRFSRFRHYGDGLQDLLAKLRPSLLAQRKRQLEEEAEIFAGVLAAASPRTGRAELTRTAHSLLAGTNSLLPYYLSAEQWHDAPGMARTARHLARILTAGARSTLRRAGQRKRAHLVGAP